MDARDVVLVDAGHLGLSVVVVGELSGLRGCLRFSPPDRQTFAQVLAIVRDELMIRHESIKVWRPAWPGRRYC